MLRKNKYYVNNVWPDWLEKLASSPQNIIFLPGIMGSELYDRRSNDVRWLDSGFEIGKLEYDKLTPSGAIDKNNQTIFARNIVDPPRTSSDLYTKFIPQMNPGLFCFDWREGIPIEAKRLRNFMELVANQTDKVNFVTHSMGGCILLHFLMYNSQFDDLIQNIVFPDYHSS